LIGQIDDDQVWSYLMPIGGFHCRRSKWDWWFRPKKRRERFFNLGIVVCPRPGFFAFSIIVFLLGVDVLITIAIFGNFRRKKFAFFSKNNGLIKTFASFCFVLSHKRKIFGDNIKKIKTLVLGLTAEVVFANAFAHKLSSFRKSQTDKRWKCV
jgi:hypothetical protein